MESGDAGGTRSFAIAESCSCTGVPKLICCIEKFALACSDPASDCGFLTSASCTDLVLRCCNAGDAAGASGFTDSTSCIDLAMTSGGPGRVCSELSIRLGQ